MVTIALTSARCSPGVTTLTVGIGLLLDEIDGPASVIEADPFGGVLGHRFGIGGDKDMLTYAAEIRKKFEPEVLFKHTKGLGRLHCLLAPVDPVASERALDMSAAILAEELPRYQMHAVVDCGRMSGRSASLPFLAAADHAFVVTRPSLDEIQASLFAVREVAKLRSAEPGLILIGDGPYSAGEITRSLGLQVFGVVADDQRTSKALTGGQFSARKLRRSMLIQSITSIAEELASTITEETGDRLPVGRAESDLEEADRVGVLNHG